MSKKRRRSQRAIAGDDRIRAACAEMLERHETMTARSVARKAGIGAASSITRDLLRISILAEFQREQDRLEEWARRAKKVSAKALEAKLAAVEAKVAERGRLVQVLVASHRAMLLAVDELGGTRAWLRFFSTFKGGVTADALAAIGAIPEGIRLLPEAQPQIRR